jgi:hypothetical protein
MLLTHPPVTTPASLKEGGIRYNGRAGKTVGWIIIGIGGWLCFMAKPPTAVSLGLLVLLWAIPAGGYNPKRIPVSIGSATVLLVLSAWLIDGSPMAFVTRYSESLSDMSAAGSSAEYGFLAGLKLDALEHIRLPPVVPMTVLLFLAGILLTLTSSSGRHWSLLMSLSFQVFCAVLALDPCGERHTLVQGWAPLPLVAGAWSVTLILPACRNLRRDHERRHPDALVATAVSLLLFPVIYGFGSNNPLPLSAPATSAFVVGAFLIPALRLGGGTGFRLAAGAAFLCQLLALSGLAASWAVPYRQNLPLWEMRDNAPLRQGGPVLRLAPSQTFFLGHLHRFSGLTGLEQDTTIIDLTAVYPLAVFAASGRSYVSPFLVAGYDWTDEAAKAIFRRTPCEDLADAWLVWTDSPTFAPVDPLTLSVAGIDFPDGYRGAFSLPGIWKDDRGRFQDIYFLEPIDSEANLARCLAVRRDSILMPPALHNEAPVPPAP